MALDIYHHSPIHHAMLADEVRNRAFRCALERSVTRDDVVLDVGAGSGALSIWAAQAGARRVYAVERSAAAAALARANTRAFGGRIRVLEGDIAEVELPEPVDLIVSEWLGAFGIDENLLGMVLLARDRWLRPGGRVLPARVTALAAPVCNSRLLTTRMPGTGAAAGGPLRWSQAGLSAKVLLGLPQTMWCTDLAALPARQAQLPFRARLQWTAQHDGVVDGTVAWFEAEFGDGTQLTNAPGAPATHWGQFVFALEPALPVRSGQEITLEIASIPAAPGFCHHAWSVRIADGPWQHHDTRGQASMVWP